jgi:hypothetical protein
VADKEQEHKCSLLIGPNRRCDCAFRGRRSCSRASGIERACQVRCRGVHGEVTLGKICGRSLQLICLSPSDSAKCTAAPSRAVRWGIGGARAPWRHHNESIGMVVNPFSTMGNYGT